MLYKEFGMRLLLAFLKYFGLITEPTPRLRSGDMFVNHHSTKNEVIEVLYLNSNNISLGFSQGVSFEAPFFGFEEGFLFNEAFHYYLGNIHD